MGSDSTLLFSELSTLLAGRYVEIPVWSFSFAEFVEIYTHLGKHQEALFVDYLELGGVCGHTSANPHKPVRPFSLSILSAQVTGWDKPFSLAVYLCG